MGLDQYIYKIAKTGVPFAEIDSDSLYENSKEIAYWRKANQIHKWFVDNIQDGKDDCENYEVTKDALHKLLDICLQVKEVFNKAKVEKGPVVNGQYWSQGKWINNYETGDVYIGLDEKALAELLPSSEGFFFGNTTYNQWYLYSIESSIEQLTQVLNETDFDSYHVYYSSSW